MKSLDWDMLPLPSVSLKVSSISPLAVIAQATAFLVVPIFTRVADWLIPSGEKIKNCIHILTSFGLVGFAGRFMEVSWKESCATAACLIVAEWMARRMGNGQDDVSKNTQETKIENKPEVAPVVSRNDSQAPVTCYVVKGGRFDETHWKDFLKMLCAKCPGINFVETKTDPGVDKQVIVMDYWGRPGGDLSASKPFGNGEVKASIIYVVVFPQENNEEIKCPEGSSVIRLVYNVAAHRKQIGDTKALEEAITSKASRNSFSSL